MNKPFILDDLALAKFGVGQPVPRNEDPTLVRGEGCYTDDLAVPGQAYGVFVRSPYAHGILRGIDGEAAMAMPGVLGIVTGRDIVAAGYGLLPCRFPGKNRDGSPVRQSPRPALPVDRVRYVGDPVALVVAETPAAARDAAEAVVLDVEPLPAVVELQDAVAEGAPQLYDEAPGNVALDFLFGDPAAVDAAFAQAAHVTAIDLVNNRVVVNPMEPRAAIGECDEGAQRWMLRAPAARASSGCGPISHSCSAQSLRMCAC